MHLKCFFTCFFFYKGLKGYFGLAVDCRASNVYTASKKLHLAHVVISQGMLCPYKYRDDQAFSRERVWHWNMNVG